MEVDYTYLTEDQRELFNYDNSCGLGFSEEDKMIDDSQIESDMDNIEFIAYDLNKKSLIKKLKR